jgi:streptogramin lyase
MLSVGDPGGLKMVFADSAVYWSRSLSRVLLSRVPTAIAVLTVIVSSVFVGPRQSLAASTQEPIGTTTTYGNVGIDDPDSITTGPDGNLWFTNYDNNSIGSMTTTGVVSNYTGSRISRPDSITMGPDGNLWFTNYGNSSIGSITTAGVVSNYTGSGIDEPDSITAGPDGNLWFTNYGNNSIGSITTSGVVSNYTGSGIDEPDSITAGPDGNLWFTNYGNSSIGSITTSGLVSNYTGAGIEQPDSITTGPDGNLWFVDGTPLMSAVGSITVSGVVTTHEMPTDELGQLTGIASGSDGRLWVTDTEDRIYAVSTSGQVTSYYGSSGNGISSPYAITAGPDGDLWFTNYTINTIASITTAGISEGYTGTPINFPQEITTGPDGNLWFTNYGNNSIGSITTSGTMTDYTGQGIDYPQAITTGADGALWFTNRFGNSIGRISTSGVVSNFTGLGIDDPFDITAGPDGNLWFTNNTGPSTGTASIGMITPSGVVTTFTGPTVNQSVEFPLAIAAGPDGALWFTNDNDTIGRITTSGVVTDYSASGIVEPNSITAGPDGAMWFTNSGTGTIGRISMAGVVTIFQGTGFNEPASIVAGPDGALWYATDTGSIDRMTTSGTITQYGSTGEAPYSITIGPDDAIWYLTDWNLIGRMSLGPPATLTSITQVTQNPVVGKPMTVDVAVSSTSTNSYPTGSVTVSDGAGGSCKAVLLGSSGQSTGSCSLTEASAGSHSLNASYVGDINFGGSSTSSPTDISVSEASSTATLSWSTANRENPVVGQPIAVEVEVSSGSGAASYPTGSVTVSDGAGGSCEAVLSGSLGQSTGSCSLTEASTGNYSLSATYPGDSNFEGSSTPSPTNVNIDDAKSTTRLTWPASKAIYGNEKKLVFTATVSPEFGGTPTGSVMVKESKKTLCTVVLLNGSGKCSPASNAVLKPGEYKIVASYSGDHDFTGSSESSSLKVKAA